MLAADCREGSGELDSMNPFNCRSRILPVPRHKKRYNSV